MAEETLPPFPPDSEHYKAALQMARDERQKAEMFGPLVSSLRNLYDMCLTIEPASTEEHHQMNEAGALIEQALNLLTPEPTKDS